MVALFFPCGGGGAWLMRMAVAFCGASPVSRPCREGGGSLPRSPPLTRGATTRCYYAVLWVRGRGDWPSVDGDGAARVAAPVALVGCLFVGLLSLLLVSPSRLTSVDHRSSLPLSAPQREAPLVGSMGSPVTVPLFPYWGGGFGGCGRQWRSSAALVSRPRAGGGGGGARSRAPSPPRTRRHCPLLLRSGMGRGVWGGQWSADADGAARVPPASCSWRMRGGRRDYAV